MRFWFEQSQPAQWWRKDPAFDAQIGQRFGELHQRALAGQLNHWAETPASCLALIIVLDQFSRNLHRGEACAFAGDEQALTLCLQALERGWHKNIISTHYQFLCMPLMHSEDQKMQEKSLQMFTGTGSEKAALAHKAIIDRFGRYPHRNAALGRVNTAAERQFLQENAGF